MPLFPYIDLSAFTEMPVAVNGAAPVGSAAASDLQKPSGNLGGLAQALIHLLANYNPGESGISELASNLQLTLPVPDWGLWALTVIYPYTYTGGESGLETVFTVPDDERAYLQAVHSRIASGDNKVSNIALVAPAAYQEGTGVAYLVGTSASVDEIFWPDPGAVQTPDHLLNHSPLLLEPGTRIQVNLDGDGVSSGILDTKLLLLKSKLIRAQTP
jgi:hypothetical protein